MTEPQRESGALGIYIKLCVGKRVVCIASGVVRVWGGGSCAVVGSHGGREKESGPRAVLACGGGQPRWGSVVWGRCVECWYTSVGERKRVAPGQLCAVLERHSGREDECRVGLMRVGMPPWGRERVLHAASVDWCMYHKGGAKMCGVLVWWEKENLELASTSVFSHKEPTRHYAKSCHEPLQVTW